MKALSTLNSSSQLATKRKEKKKQIKSLINLNEFKFCTLIIMANRITEAQTHKMIKRKKTNAAKRKLTQMENANKHAVRLYFNTSTSSQTKFVFLFCASCLFTAMPSDVINKQQKQSEKKCLRFC